MRERLKVVRSGVNCQDWYHYINYVHGIVSPEQPKKITFQQKSTLSEFLTPSSILKRNTCPTAGGENVYGTSILNEVVKSCRAKYVHCIPVFGCQN